MRKLAAWLNLAWHFALHVTTRMTLRPFRHGRDLARFTGSVEGDGYVALEPDARTNFPRYMNCIQCGLCAIPCESLQSAPASAWDEAWTFVTGASRSLDRTQLVAHDLSACAHAATAQAVCPAGIPINEMAAVISRMAKP